MARICKIEIGNFRSIQSLCWRPNAGVNCIIGPGDSGKSTVLDAIDLCLGARKLAQFTDDDFYNLDVDKPISISLTLGDLDDDLKNLDTYGLYLRGFNPETGDTTDEPEKDCEIVLTINLTVGSDLDPVWSLISDRAKTQNASRNLSWGDRLRIAPTRIGYMTDFNLGWRKGSILNRLADEEASASAALAKAARDARQAFGGNAETQLGETLRIVGETAHELGIGVGDNVHALLDAHSVSFGAGSIALHDEQGVPLRNLGLGSSRLLIAGLQRKASVRSSMLLVDELEHGLEPHRIIRFLNSLGAKEAAPAVQSFLTTHSPVVLRELRGNQMFVLRSGNACHNALNVGDNDETQSTIRLFPEAFLASSVLVCEGASEVGFVRGLDQYRVSQGRTSLFSCGASLVDAGGGDVEKLLDRAETFQQLGYRVALLRDSDKPVPEDREAKFVGCGGTIFAWRSGKALEDELFGSLSEKGADELLSFAIALHGEELVNEHIKSKTSNIFDLSQITLIQGYTTDARSALGVAARVKRQGWFKSISWMEEAANTIIGPNLSDSDEVFQARVDSIFNWLCHD